MPFYFLASKINYYPIEYRTIKKRKTREFEEKGILKISESL